ncbi:MAG: Gfo/Idh/MocA family protein [Alphaproteobacteria bacterium]
MKVAIIGCGYVFDHYMATWSRHPVLELKGVADIRAERTEAVSKTYGVAVYESAEAIFADDEIELVLNLTSIDSHAAIIRAALEAGKHVYTEKPVTEHPEEVRALFALAAERGLQLSAAPCNILSDTVVTMRRALEDGVVGAPRVVYAEFDDNPIDLMKPEGWRSRSGAPWPWKDEYEHGCTVEHAGYYLTWLIALFGPVARITAFSKVTAPDKAGDVALTPSDAADFSVACLDFENGVTARVTMSITAPYDQRFRVIGDRGELWTDTYRHFQNPVWFEPFTQLSLNARKARAVRQNGSLRWLFGVGGRRIPLIHRPAEPGAPRSPRGVKAWLRRQMKNQLGAQDKCLGPALMATAIETGQPPPLPPDFIMHVNELTMAMHRAGVSGRPIALQTTCTPPSLERFAMEASRSRAYPAPGALARLADGVIARMHRH